MTIWHQLSDFGEEMVSWNYYKQRGLQASKSIPYTSVSSQFFLPLVFFQQFSVRSFPANFPAKLRRPFQKVLHPSLDSFNSQYIPFPFYFEFPVVIQCQRISGDFPANRRYQSVPNSIYISGECLQFKFLVQLCCVFPSQQLVLIPPTWANPYMLGVGLNLI